MKPNPYAELLQALQRNGSQSSDGMTTREIAEALKCCSDTAVKKLQTAISAGRVVYAGKRTITTIDGKRGQVPVYKLVKGAK